MANNDHNVNRMNKCMENLRKAKEERKDYQEEAMQGGHWESEMSQVKKEIKQLVAECNRQHKALEGHPLATKHFPSWVRSRRWKGEKIKGGRRTRRSRRKRRRVRRKRTHKRNRRSRRKRRRFKKRTKKR